MALAKVLFLGTLGVMSHAIMQRLLKHKLNIVGVVLPGPEPFKIPGDSSTISIPVLQQPQHDTIELLAIKHDIPLVYIQDINSLETYNTLSKFDADFILIGCFPYILPLQIQTLPNMACLNLHPSMLPAYRGPVPQFWQLRDGIMELGVTLHLVSQDIDGGDIILQDAVRLKDGMRARAIDAALGELGGTLFIEALRLYGRQSVVPLGQDDDEASYFPVPTIYDFNLSLQWSARHAFNFMRGTDEWQQPYRLLLNDQELFLLTPIAYSPGGSILGDHEKQGEVITIAFAQGLLQAEFRR